MTLEVNVTVLRDIERW